MPQKVSLDSASVLRLHRSWADRHMVFWCGVAILMFAGCYVIARIAGIDAADRATAYVLIGTLLTLGVVWHAAGLLIARIHVLLEGIALEVPEQRPPEIITGF
jgi:Kef-type K+ transport system membrane component KefB